MTLIKAQQLVTPDEVLKPGFVRFENGIITEVGRHTDEAADYDFAGMLLPGFVDIHCHGGAGSTFPNDAEKIANFHRKHGTTTLIASLVSAPVAELPSQIEALRPAVEAGVIRGIHLEGPFLSPAKCGAQNPTALSDPTPDAITAIIESGIVVMVTIAPELPGAIEAISRLAAAGIRVALGHSQADGDTTLAAIDAGATIITHLFNAMPAINHREPSLTDVALVDDRVSAEVIADGHHLSLEALQLASKAKGARLIAVTDAISAAGMPDGQYDLGGIAVTRRHGVARTPSGALAGSTLTPEYALITLTTAAGLDLATATRALATEPARALGLTEVGAIEVGRRADFAHWCTGIAEVFRAGELCE